ncbi:phosphonate metabolism protein/1,5-bisphosphokinase (PRPP-forming) PhnN [Pseudomonas aeruginosa]
MTGRLIYLMGPSGSGQGQPVAGRARAPGAARLPYRAAGDHALRGSGGEDAQAVTPAQFDTLERASAFAMSWRANGLCYGIPVQIDEWLAQGYDVLVNGSRGYLAQARRRYPDLLAVLLGVKPEVLRQRLLARGRESPEEIEARLARNAEFAAGLEGPLFQLDNSGDLDDTLRTLLARLGSDRACA